MITTVLVFRIEFSNFTQIDRMEVMVLLDLLGAMNPNFYSHFSNTHSLYSRFVKIEQKLNDLNRMEAHPPHLTTNYFKTTQSWYGGIDDDHKPFESRGVPIVHIIPTPFPNVWHKDSDNKENIHNPTVNNLIKIFKLFVVQYLHLDIN
jgi:glutaminyl-peptide cyclotransferase